jgi:hypothetical protein
MCFLVCDTYVFFAFSFISRRGGWPGSSATRTTVPTLADIVAVVAVGRGELRWMRMSMRTLSDSRYCLLCMLRVNGEVLLHIGVRSRRRSKDEETYELVDASPRPVSYGISSQVLTRILDRL